MEGERGRKYEKEEKNFYPWTRNNKETVGGGGQKVVVKGIGLQLAGQKGENRGREFI